MRMLFLFLLCSTFCFGQKIEDYAKVSIYTITNEIDDGPCSVLSYIEFGEVGGAVQAYESYNREFAYKLLELKKEAISKWPQSKFDCSRRCIGCDMVHSMFVIEINAYRDTIFTTKDPNAIFSPKKQIAYLDKLDKIKKAFPKDVTSFFEDAPIYLHRSMLDSISVEEIRLNNKIIYGLNRKTFEEAFKKFDHIHIDSILHSDNLRVDKNFELQNIRIWFSENENTLEKLELEHTDYKYNTPHILYLSGIKAGDNEDSLKKKFPESIKYKLYTLPHYTASELHNNYFYEVLLKNNHGSVNFYIQDKIITMIQLNLNPQLKP